MIGDGGGKIIWSELLEVCEVKRTNGCAMVFKCTEGKTAEFVVVREFNHIIDKRIITKFQPSELPCGKYDKIAVRMSITKAGLYINDIMEVCIISCFYAEAGPKYINAGRLLFTRRETGIEVRQQSWNKLATRVAI